MIQEAFRAGGAEMLLDHLKTMLRSYLDALARTPADVDEELPGR